MRITQGHDTGLSACLVFEIFLLRSSFEVERTLHASCMGSSLNPAEIHVRGFNALGSEA